MNIGLLLLRLAVGLTLAAHGAQKLFGWFGGYGLDGTGQFMETLGFHPGRRHALMAGLVEFGGGLLLALGFLTPLGAAFAASVMLVAIATVHLKNGFFAAGGGYEFNVVLAAAAVTLAFTGPGVLSIDGLFGFANGGIATGIASVAIAAVGGVSQLAQRRVSSIAQPFKTAA